MIDLRPGAVQELDPPLQLLAPVIAGFQVLVLVRGQLHLLELPPAMIRQRFRRSDLLLVLLQPPLGHAQDFQRFLILRRLVVGQLGLGQNILGRIG